MKITNNLLTILSIVSSIALILLIIFLNIQAKNYAKSVDDLQKDKNNLEEQNREAKISLEIVRQNLSEKKELSKKELSELKDKLKDTKKILEKLVAVSPRPTCGDPNPNDIFPITKKIKINWFPVFVSIDRLDEIKQHFCKDAFLNTHFNKVQVSSFLTKKRAEEFSNWIQGEVGEPTHTLLIQK